MTAHDVLVERLVRAGKAAGQDALARVAYEMARRCMFLAKGTPKQGVRWVVEPGEVGSLYGELVALEARTGIEIARDELPVSDPAPEAALRFSRACLEVVASVEGESPRVEFRRAKLARAEGDRQDYADRLRALSKRELTKPTYLLTQGCRQAALLTLGRFDEVANLGAVLLEHHAQHPMAAFNRLTALGWMEVKHDFRHAADQMQRSLRGVGDPEFWAQLLRDEAPWLAMKFDRDPIDVLRALGLSGLDRSPREEPS